MVEQIGSGISRMRDLMKEAGLTPPEYTIDGMFTVSFRRPFDFDKWVNKWANNLSEKQTVILKAIHNNPKIKKSELQVLDTFFVPFYCTKNTRTDVFNNYIQKFR